MAALVYQVILVSLCVGVSRPRHISYYDNASPERPIITVVQEHRICAELCMAGLGGEPCGPTCPDVLPQGLVAAAAGGGGVATPQSAVGRGHDEDEHEDEGEDEELPECARSDACPLLCGERLGYPLCNCTYGDVEPFFRPDFLKICMHFCESYDYRIYGCDTCDVYRNMTASGTVPQVPHVRGLSQYVWKEWCIQVCQEGDGGSACFCDLLPMKAAP